jgi:hypothetical protein
LRLESIVEVQLPKERPVRRKGRKEIAVSDEICSNDLALLRIQPREKENGREALIKVKRLRRLAARDSAPPNMPYSIVVGYLRQIMTSRCASLLDFRI